VKNSALSGFLLLACLGGGACAQTVEDLNIANRSAFEVSNDFRDPLLPIGWTKSSPIVVPIVNGVPVPPPIEAYIRPEAFLVSSISVAKLPLAIINGKQWGEGDLMPFVAGTEKIMLQVFAIRDGSVVLRYKDHKITCPIRSVSHPGSPAPTLPPPPPKPTP